VEQCAPPGFSAFGVVPAVVREMRRLGGAKVTTRPSGALPLKGRGRFSSTATATRSASSTMCTSTWRPRRLASSLLHLGSGADFDYVVHQATGMVAAQLEVSVGQALVRLCAYAFGNDRPLTDVAWDVVARKLRFDAASRENDRGT